MPRVDIFSLGVGVAAFYFVFFLLVPLLQALGVDVGVPNTTPLSREAAAVIGAGLAGLLGGYLLLPRSLVRRVPDVFAEAWDYRRAAWVVGILATLGIVGKIVRIAGGGYFHIGRSTSFLSSPFVSLIGYLDWVWLIAFGIALLVYYALAHDGALHARRWGVVSGALFAIGAVFAVFSCGREGVFLIVILYLLIRWYAKRIAWWKVILSIALAVAIIFPLGNVCRSEAGRDHFFSEVTRGETITAPVSAAVRVASDSFFSRINHSFTITHVVAFDLEDFMSSFLQDIFVNLGPPRFLWADKPVSINARGNEFGHRIGVLAPDDPLTAVGPTLPGELFINFGVAGVLIGMFLFGLLLKFLYVYLIARGVLTLSGILVHGVAWLTLLRGLEVWAVPLIAGFVKLFIFLLVIHFIVRKRS